MKNSLIATITFSAALLFTGISCSTFKAAEKKVTTPTENLAAHTSNNSLDWQGVYKGVLPCADCEGIETRITLKKDGTFQRTMKYLGKDDKVFSDEGKIVWDNSGNKITLKAENAEQLYQVGENVLFHLDKEGNRITGNLAENYKLMKNKMDPKLEDKKWILTELRGKPLESTNAKQKGYIQFSMETGRFSGNNTCNNFFGQYELMEGNRIKFGKAGTTLMACPDMETQRIFMEVLEMADNYTITDNELMLNKARMAPLARFRLDIP
jgi:heat shock protein HslJ